MAKRKQGGDTDATGPVPELLPTNVMYFDVEWFIRDVRAHIGNPNAGLKPMAQALGINRDTIRRLIRDRGCIHLDTYARFCAILGRPYGSWLRLK